jgi:hypothetical protein
MKSGFLKTALLLVFAMLLANQAYAQTNEPPPAGTVILDLNGMAIPHSYQVYTTAFSATSTSTNLSFAFREDPAFLFLSDVTVTNATTGSSTNILLNGDFSSGIVGNSAPVDWTYLNTFGAAYGGFVQSGCGLTGNNCYYDGAVQAYDAITQALTTIPGDTYDVSFYLYDDSGLSTFSSVSTNGVVNGTGGNGADLLVYAGAIPTAATPLPAALPLFATGLGLTGLLGWRRKRKNAAAIAA